MENSQPAPMPSPPPQSSTSQNPPPSGSAGAKFSLQADARSIETLKWSAIWNAVSNAIDVVVGYAASFFFGGLIGEILEESGGYINKFPFENLISEVFWGAVYGAIAGFLLSKFYTKIQEWNQKYLRGKLNTLFKLLFYPALVGNILAFLMTSFIGLAVGFLPIIIMFAGFVLSSYIYAKMLSKKVEHMYS